MKWNMFEYLADDLESRLRLALARNDAELPIINVVASTKPFISPGKNEKTGAAAGKNGARLPFEHPSLRGLAIAQAVQTNFSHHERTFVREILQTRHVCLQFVLRFQVDVERNEVQKRQIEIFRRRIIYICNEPLGVFVLGSPIEAFKEFFDATVAVPPDDRRGNFVADGIGKESRMSITGSNGFADTALQIADAAGVVQKGDVLFPGQADHHAQLVFQRDVEQPAGWHRVSADCINIAGSHQCEIAFNGLLVVVFAAVSFRFERTVSDATHIKLFVANKNEFSSHAWARWCSIGGRRGWHRFGDFRCRTGR